MHLRVHASSLHERVHALKVVWPLMTSSVSILRWLVISSEARVLQASSAHACAGLIDIISSVSYNS